MKPTVTKYNPKTDFGKEGFGQIINNKTGKAPSGYNIGKPVKPAPTKKKRKIITKGKYVTMQ